MPHVEIRPAPASLRPTAVGIVRRAQTLWPDGDPNVISTEIQQAWSGWSRLDKLRLATMFAWIAGVLVAQISDDVQREAFLAELEEE